LKRLHKILFELSNVERIDILLDLQKEKLKLSPISQKLKLTATETARHLRRLEETELIEKDKNGYFGITPLGTLALSLLSGLGFVWNNRKFFSEYDTSAIPYQLINRIGEIDQGTWSSETIKNLEEGEKKIREAQKFVWILSDQVLTNTIPILKEKIKSPFDLRIILPEGKFPPESQSVLPSTTIGIQKRVLQKIEVLTVITEYYAIFCLPNRKGRIDYTGFSGEDNKFRQWCKDLFLHYWENAKRVSPA
jgi:predicted transcriptional regulator